jgi:hypothetical protein
MASCRQLIALSWSDWFESVYLRPARMTEATLMIEQVLAETAWQIRLNANDRRGLTPLIYSHVNPYGSFQLDLNS